MTDLELRILRAVPGSGEESNITFYDMETAFGECWCNDFPCEHQQAAESLGDKKLVEFVGMNRQGCIYRRTTKGDEAVKG